MTERLTDDKSLFGWLKDRQRDHECVQGALEREFGLCMCYYEGQTGTLSVTPSLAFNGGLLRALPFNRDVDSGSLRVGLNRTSKLVQRAAVATQPTRIEVDVVPPDRDAGIDAAVKAQIVEDTLNTAIDLTGFLSAWCTANFGRSVCGTYGIGWCLKSAPTPMEVDGERKIAPDVQLEAFSFLPTKLTLDPRIEDRDLTRHEYVIYSDAWSIGKFMRVYGDRLRKLDVKIDPESLKTFGDLATFELSVNNVSNGRLFSRYRSESRTRCVMIHQIHRKSEEGGGYGRFDRYDVVLELPDRQVRLSEPEQDSPFGGCGMPFRLLHAHRRPDSIWSIGDCKMLVDDQDRLNRLQTYLERQLQNNSRMKWLLDKSSLGMYGRSVEQIAKAVNNRDSGIIIYETSMTHKGNPPAPVPVPPPQAFLLDSIDRTENAMREQVHRAEGHFGAMKSHVPDASFQRAIDEAGQVLDMRVAEDKRIMEQMLTDLGGTISKLLADESPGLIAALAERGVEPEEIVTLAEMNPYLPPYTVRVRDSSIRLRSYAARKQDLDTAAQMKMIAPADYRRELAGMDIPLTADDKLYRISFDRIAREVMLGITEVYQPIPLGDRTGDMIDSFRRAALDRRADAAARERLNQAILSQQLMFQQEQALLAPPPSASPGSQVGSSAAQPAEPIPDEAAFSDLIGQIAPQAEMAAV